jgi:type IV pilus assembly protein PilA
MTDSKSRFNTIITKYLFIKYKKNGFTLIELLVVIIIIGVLSAVALPSLIAQVGKARESEAKINLGSMSRSQQAYHVEKQRFADDLNKLSINGSYKSKYFDFELHPLASDDTYVDNVKHRAVAIKPNEDHVRDYAMGVYYNSGAFINSFCQGSSIGASVEVGVTAADSCTNGGIKIE